MSLWASQAVWSHQGYVLKRTTASSPPGMQQRGFCVLYGTLLLEYATQEEAETTMKPREAYEVIGVSSWDGRGRVHVYPNAFMIVTHLGTTLYLSTEHSEEKDGWISSIRCALECSFANASLHHLKPPKERYPAPPPTGSAVCIKSGMQFGVTQTPQYCASCGGAFLADHCKDMMPFPQLGTESSLRVCADCSTSQALLFWLDVFIYHHLMEVHHSMSQPSKDSVTFAESIKLRRRKSRLVATAADLLDHKSIDLTEFMELVRVDYDATAEKQQEEVRQHRIALRELGSDVHTLILYLINAADPNKSPQLFTLVLERLLEVGMGCPINADNDGNRTPSDERDSTTSSPRSDGSAGEIGLIDFYWPQLMQLHLKLTRRLTPNSIPFVDAFQTFLLILAARYFCLAEKLTWSLKGILEDAKIVPSPFTHTQYISCVCLLFQLEKVVMGSIGVLEGGHVINKLELDRVAYHQKATMMQLLAILFSSRSTKFASWLQCHAASLSSPSADRSFSRQPSLLCLDQDNNISEIYRQQMQFLEYLTTLVDDLRFIDRSQCKTRLLEQLRELQSTEKPMLGYSPTTTASDPVLQIVHIVLDSCHVFRTKARAPSLIVAEVVQATSAPQHRRRRRFPSEHVVNEDEIERTISTNIASFMEGLQSAELEQTADSQPLEPIIEEEAAVAAAVAAAAAAAASAGAERSSPSLVVDTAASADLTDTMGESAPLASDGSTESATVVAADGESSRASHGTPSPRKHMTPRKPLDLETQPAVAHVLRTLGEAETDSNPTDDTLEDDAVFQKAKSLLAAKVITEKEFFQIINKDKAFREENENIDVEFWIARRYGESWSEKVLRLRESSPYGHMQGWGLCSFIIKSNDDLRQETCCMQLIELCSEIFKDHGLPLRLRPYRILATSSCTGIVETLLDTISLDALKKTEGFENLRSYFHEVYSTSSERLEKAKMAFASSLAAYSLVCYLLQIKDRHNGNILLDRDGSIIHIDFGFIMGIAPGGNFSLESAPFKLTTEMVDVLDGFRSPYFSEFVHRFISGFLVLQSNAEIITRTFEMMVEYSQFPCLVGQDRQRIVERLRSRFRLDLPTDQAAKFCMDLIMQSYNHYGTRQYDSFQWYTNGIMP